jgi:hypothetical protein
VRKSWGNFALCISKVIIKNKGSAPFITQFDKGLKGVLVIYPNVKLEGNLAIGRQLTKTHSLIYMSHGPTSTKNTMGIKIPFPRDTLHILMEMEYMLVL